MNVSKVNQKSVSGHKRLAPPVGSGMLPQKNLSGRKRFLPPVVPPDDSETLVQKNVSGHTRHALVDSENEEIHFDKSASARSAQQNENEQEMVFEEVQQGERADGTQSTQQKKKRGPTTMETLRKGTNQKKLVSFNLNGQPIGENSDKFVSFLGVTARLHIPITIRWKDLENENWKTLKDDVWSLIQESFNVDDTHKDITFRLMGNYWRQYKSKITHQLIKANKQSNKSNRGRTFQHIKPANVRSTKDWDNFVKSRFTTSFQATSEKFSALRKSQQYTHTMSRKGYARLEYEMKTNHPNPNDITRADMWAKGHQRKNGSPINDAAGKVMEKIRECNESIDNPPSKDCIKDDALARVLGPETRGRVRGLGFGATPSKVGILAQGNARVKELEARLNLQDHRVGALEAKIEALLKKIEENSGNNFENHINKHTATPESESEQASNHAHGESTQLVNARCLLLNWYNYDGEDEVVGEGSIVSIDPRSKVHHVPLGKDCWKVWVDQVIDKKMALYRSTLEFQKLGEAIGNTIAWPRTYIKLL